jgi:hypothetical protein
VVPRWVRPYGHPVVPGQRWRPADGALGMGVGQIRAASRCSMAAKISSITRTLASASILGSFPSRIDRDAGQLLSAVSREHSFCSPHEVDPLSGRARLPVTSGHGQGGEAVEAPVVALGAVGGQGGVVLAPCPLVEQVALAGVVVERDRVAAGVDDTPDLDHDNGTGAAAGREPRRELLPAVVPGQDDPSLPMQPQDPRRPEKAQNMRVIRPLSRRWARSRRRCRSDPGRRRSARPGRRRCRRSPWARG